MHHGSYDAGVMFIEQLKADIKRGGAFTWKVDPTLLFTVEMLTKRAPDPDKVEAQFEGFYRSALAAAPVETLDRAGYDALLAQPPTTTLQEMHTRWLEFSEPLPGLEPWKGCLIAPMTDPRKVFGATTDNTRPTSVCYLLLFGDKDTFSVSAIQTDRGRLDTARIVPQNVSDQAVISGTSRAQKQREIDSVMPLWLIALALEAGSHGGGLSA